MKLSLIKILTVNKIEVKYSKNISEVVRDPLFLILRQLLITLGIQADVLNTLCNPCLSSKKWNKSFCLTVIANIFLIISASYSDSLDSPKIGWSVIYYFLLSMKELSTRYLESNRLPLLPTSATPTSYVCRVLFGWVIVSLYALFSKYLIIFSKNCKVLVCSTNAKLLYYLSILWLILYCNVSMQLLHFLLNLRPSVLRQVLI